MRFLPGILVAAITAAGCDEPPPASTPEYQQFLVTQLKTSILSGGTLTGTVLVVPPAPRAAGAEVFCELFVNGKKLGRFSLSEGDEPLQFENVRLRSGVNRVALWDSSANRGSAESLDSRAGTHIEIRVTENGVEMIPTPE